MSWGAVIAVGGSLIAGAMSSNAGEDAADAQSAASDRATAEAGRQYDQTREDLQPWMQAGGWALGEQRNFLQGDMSGFYNSAAYQAAIRQGTAQLDAGATAGGNLWGGGTDADRIMFGQDTAMRFAGDHYNRLAGMSNTGQTTGTQLGQFGANYATQYGQNQMNAADAQSSAYMNTANNWGNVLATGVGAWNQRQGNRPPGGG